MWYELPGFIRARLVDGDLRGAVFTNGSPLYLGNVYYDGGSGYQNGNTGTVVFLRSSLAAGVVLSLF